jgi:adenylate cyclase
MRDRRSETSLAAVEIERKFVVDGPPPELSAVPSERIQQGYLAVDSAGVEVRIRRRDGRATLTVKQGSGLVRGEEEVEIGRRRFDRLWPVTEGRRIVKARHVLPVDGVRLEVDVYGGDLSGLVVAEVEFESVEASEAFVPPEWLGREVTGDDRYANRTLAVEGWPDGPPPYRLDGDGDGVAASVRAVVRGRLDKATGGLAAAEGDALAEAVHSARKSLKRVRSCLRLVRDALGDETYRAENAAFRDASRRLSGARDSEVMLGTLDALGERYGDEISAGDFGALRAALDKERTAAHAKLSGEATTGEVLGDLRAARARIASWPLDEVELAELGPGLRRAYRRGRKAQRAAEAEHGDEALHELRKRVKDLWYMSELVRPAAPKRAKKLASRASDLSDVIGEDHDLAVLRETVDRLRGRLSKPEFDKLVDVIARRRSELQKQLRRAARRMYRDKPRKAVRRLGLEA